jgi:trehalose synthase
VGLDDANTHAREAWNFLRGYVLPADAFVFSRAGFAWDGLPRDRISVIRPSIDAFAPKNAEQDPEQSMAILSTAGIRGSERLPDFHPFRRHVRTGRPPCGDARGAAART